MIICMIAATVTFIVYVYLFVTASDDMVAAIIGCCMETELENIKKYRLSLETLAEDIQHSKGEADKDKIKKGKAIKKKLDEATKRYEMYSSQKISVIDIIPIAGYRLLQILGWDATNETVKKLTVKCRQFKEKKEAVNYTYYILGSMFGYFALGICLCFLLAGLSLALGLGTRSIVVAGAALVVFGLLGYLPYDNVDATIRKRADEIENQFPQAVSKMALLTVAGMEVNQAWKLACAKDQGVLYDEMRRVLTDLDNNVPPVEAYSKFITRCNNTYTTKLGTAIMQNISKGNSEIVKLFRSLNDESWMEHKHNARRKGEAISNKLLVPTLLMFVGILILVMVPVMSGFGF